MFDLFVSGIQAYNQVGYFIGALICLGIGGLLLGYSLYWRMHALRATGTIIGVTGANGMYTPVYRYTLNGETHEAKSDMSSGWIKGKETGRVVPLLISAHNPTEARTRNDYWLELVGLVIIVPGLWLGHTALTAYPVTWMTWVMAGAMLFYLAERAHSIFIPKGERISIAEWRKQHNLDSSASIDLATVKPIEQLVTNSGGRPSWGLNRKWTPLVGVFALLLAALGVFQGYRMSQLEASGLRAPGAVVSLREEESGNNSSYYPVVRYRTDKNLSVEFKDSVGSNPPSYRPGDKVTVLYLADAPQRAVIDRGVWNWAIPVILVLAASFVAWLTLAMFKSGAPKPA